MKLRAKISIIVICAITAATAFAACNKSDEVVINSTPTTQISEKETETTKFISNSPTEKNEITTITTTSPLTTTSNNKNTNGNKDINADNIDRMETGDIRDGDVIEQGDYIYTYYTLQNGWSVEVVDKTQTKYGTIKSKLYNIPVVSMQGCFYKCNNMVSAPQIPESIINMESCFSECKKLSGEIIIPKNVTNLSYCFFASSNTIDTVEIHSHNVSKATGIFNNCSPNIIKLHENSSTFETLMKNTPSNFSSIMVSL